MQIMRAMLGIVELDGYPVRGSLIVAGTFAQKGMVFLQVLQRGRFCQVGRRNLKKLSITSFDVRQSMESVYPMIGMLAGC